MINAFRVIVSIKYALVLTGIIIGTLGALGHSAYRASTLDAEADLTSLIEAEARLLGDLGSGGLIHNFKNYVLRGSEKYRIAAFADYPRLVETLDRLGDLTPTDMQDEIGIVRRTIDTYIAQLDVAQAAVERGADAATIDALVKTDDTHAIHALTKLIAELRERHTGDQELRRQDLQVFVRGMLMLIVTILILVFLLIMETARIHHAERENAQH